jgi:hypothetical protein
MDPKDREARAKKMHEADMGVAGKFFKNKEKFSGSGKGDHVSGAWINTEKYQRSMAANDAYAAGKITLEEWRAIVYSKGQGDSNHE